MHKNTVNIRHLSVLQVLYAASNQIVLKFLFISLFGLIRLFISDFLSGPIIVRRP